MSTRYTPGGYWDKKPPYADDNNAATKPEHRGEEACVRRVDISRRELTFVEALDYEVSASWWASWIGSPTLQDWAARYYAWKSSRKWARFQETKARARRVKRYIDLSSATANEARADV